MRSLALTSLFIIAWLSGNEAAAAPVSTTERDMKTRVVFSAVKGRVLHKGKPVAGLEINQRWTWLGIDDGEYSTKTDGDGRFTLPEVTVEKLTVNDDVLIMQEITAEHRDTTIRIWDHTRQSLSQNDELGGEPISFTVHLDGEPREIRVPRNDEDLAVINGVLDIEHPYLERLDRVREALSLDRVKASLLEFLNTDTSRPRLLSFFPKIAGRSPSVTGIAEIEDLSMSDWVLLRSADRGRLAHGGEGSFVGFTLKGQVSVTFADRSPLSVGFFGFHFHLPINARGAPQYTLGNSYRWEVHTNEYLKGQIKERIDTDRLVALVVKRLGSKDSGFLGGFAARRVSVVGARLFDFDVSYVKREEGYAAVAVHGEADLNVDKSKAFHRFRGTCYVTLDSLAQPAYGEPSVQEPPVLALIRFRIALSAAKARFSVGEPIRLSFTIENLLDQPERYLDWHTPFEGFRNRFLEVTNVKTNALVDYEGIMASRGPPSEADYLKLKAGAKLSTEFELNEAYSINSPGTYRIEFIPLHVYVQFTPLEIVVE